MNAKIEAAKAYIVENKKTLLKKGLIAVGSAIGIAAVALLVKHEIDQTPEETVEALDVAEEPVVEAPQE